MDRERVQALARAQGQTETRGRVQIDIEKDLRPECRFVDFLLASSLRTGRCAKLLRNFMLIYAAKIPQLAQGKNHLFDPEGICQTIKVLEGHEIKDITRGPFQFEKDRLKGSIKSIFFNPAS
ncbi:hypothetical protein [Methylobacterium sp. E-066]|uniref:hypothetical protein n=1 Tax=Methylobacterium sp. E-066 TaxID=2836584 RepID=UPI001FBAC9F4|nr:hypothetical protein [Methylobacterium sp. E-066]MCJ2144307.1 hypothetical protein [Methylobacterium sp. E-066]